jgi:hypothetical protein
MDRFELVEGRTVLLQIADGEYRPAIVVKVSSPETANLVVFLDGTNDADRLAGLYLRDYEPDALTAWAASRQRGESVGQWITPQELFAIRAGV